MTEGVGPKPFSPRSGCCKQFLPPPLTLSPTTPSAASPQLGEDQAARGTRAMSRIRNNLFLVRPFLPHQLTLSFLPACPRLPLQLLQTQTCHRQLCHPSPWSHHRSVLDHMHNTVKCFPDLHLAGHRVSETMCQGSTYSLDLVVWVRSSYHYWSGTITAAKIKLISAYRAVCCCKLRSQFGRKLTIPLTNIF